MFHRFVHLLGFAETVLVRFWMSICSALWGVWAASVDNWSEFNPVMALLAPQSVWVGLFFVNAVSLMYGVATRRYSSFQLILEAVLGCILWSSAAIGFWLASGHPNASVGGMLVAMHLLIRYPTHYCWRHHPPPEWSASHD